MSFWKDIGNAVSGGLTLGAVNTSGSGWAQGGGVGAALDPTGLVRRGAGTLSGGNAPYKDSSYGGSANEIQGRLEGLERAKTLIGQNPHEIGQDYQTGMGNLRKRMDGSDTSAELLRANKAGAVADAKNTLQAQGVKGGAALNAIGAVERAKAYDVNNQIQQAQKDAETRYLNAVKSNANFTNQMEMAYGQMAAGKDVQMPSNNSSGFGGTVICTELYRNGYFTEEMWQKDQEYGRELINSRPEVYIGYRFFADPIVRQMKKSKRFTKLVSKLGVPWAKHISGKKNLLGGLISFIGEPLCGLVGKIIVMREGVIRGN